MVVLAGAPALLLLLPPPELPLLTPGNCGAAAARRMLTVFFNTLPFGTRLTRFTLTSFFFIGVDSFFLIAGLVTPLPDIAAAVLYCILH
jgi:hypothetical protein